MRGQPGAETHILWSSGNYSLRPCHLYRLFLKPFALKENYLGHNGWRPLFLFSLASFPLPLLPNTHTHTHTMQHTLLSFSFLCQVWLECLWTFWGSHLKIFGELIFLLKTSVRSEMIASFPGTSRNTQLSMARSLKTMWTMVPGAGSMEQWRKQVSWNVKPQLIWEKPSNQNMSKLGSWGFDSHACLIKKQVLSF